MEETARNLVEIRGPRRVDDADWRRFEGYIGEIFTAFGMEPDTPGTERTPERFLKAMYDATAGYEGDPKLLTAFPTECRCDADCLVSQIVEGPISFYADALTALMEPHGVAVHLEAVHLCTQMRGVREERSKTVTSVWRSGYTGDPDLRREFLAELHNRNPWT